MSAEHAATSLALVPIRPRLPFLIRRTVGLLRSALRATQSGLTPFARIHRSNGVSNLVGIGFFPSVSVVSGAGAGGGWRRYAEGERVRSVIPQLHEGVKERDARCAVRSGWAASRHNCLSRPLSPSRSYISMIDCGLRCSTKNGPHRVAKRCLYSHEKTSFCRTLTTSAARELGVALSDASG